MNASDKARLNQVPIPVDTGSGKQGDSTRGVGDLVDRAITDNNNAMTPSSGTQTITGALIAGGSTGATQVAISTSGVVSAPNITSQTGIYYTTNGAGSNFGFGTSGGQPAIFAGSASVPIYKSNQIQVGSNAPSAYIIGLLTADTTAVASATAGPNNLISYTLPANSIITTARGLRIYAWGTTTNNANAKTLTLEFGSQTIMTQDMTTNEANTWEIEAMVFRTGSSTQDIMCRLHQLTGTALRKGTVTAGTQTETGTIVIKCTATNEVTQEGLLVEAL